MNRAIGRGPRQEVLYTAELDRDDIIQAQGLVLRLTPWGATPKAMEELVRALKIWKLVNGVDPTSEQVAPLLAKFNQLEELKRRYRQEHRHAMDRLHELKNMTADSEIQQAELQATLDHYHGLESNFIQQRQGIKESIAEGLTLEQQVKFEVFSYNYWRDLKQTLQTLVDLQRLGVEGKLQDFSANREGRK